MTGWCHCCSNNACNSSGSTGALTAASGAGEGGSQAQIPPLPSVQLLELSWERKVIASLPAQPTAHDFLQSKSNERCIELQSGGAQFLSQL